jgi:hypothetical protein
MITEVRVFQLSQREERDFKELGILYNKDDRKEKLCQDASLKVETFFYKDDVRILRNTPLI